MQALSSHRRRPLDSGAVVEAFASRLGLRYGAVGWHAFCQPDAAADRRTTADGDAPENGRAGVDDDFVFKDGMPLAALDDGPGLVDLKPLRPQRDRLIEPHATTDPRRLTDHNAGAVIDEEALADLGAGMNVNAGLRVSEFGNDPGQHR